MFSVIGIEFQEIVKGRKNQGENKPRTPSVPTHRLTPVEADRIISMAVLAARARSAVVRDEKSGQIDGLCDTEHPVRMSTALSQLYLGMAEIGVKEEDRWRGGGKGAAGCMPGAGRVCL